MRHHHQCTFTNTEENNQVFYLTTNPRENADYLLIHGYGSNCSESHTINKLIQYISSKNAHSVISAMDYYGHGKTNGKIENFTITKGYSDVLAMLQNNCKNTCKIIGNSMGGLLAFIASYRIGLTAICIAPPIYCLDKDAATEIGYDAFADRLGTFTTDEMFENWLSEIPNIDAGNAMLFYGMNDTVVDPYISIKSAQKSIYAPKIILKPNASHSNHADDTINLIGSYI